MPAQKPFQLNLSYNNIDEVNGYLKAMIALKKCLEEETEFNPDKRFIDSVMLLDKIQATSDALRPLFANHLNNIISKLN